ncbi:UDP-N-acetylmuramoyl-L-alanine--D-glutamate ligase [Chengkuizengella axinellae]|uniref:UDP-N-acetylmuramoylalanine--D-glutamate ligase n=1 Tax=Chengkuizengella axinellae TaxID=3064388 RepID=A0ABT9IUY2_9BACL|nr:UDP-N-acetylmuramoyl-L-alanine--D-glutamate ligase [Chengkuizengella sp. 2205SS18-9]MDP5273155.1 UDP-N-acetylmuramoyl-L-alanine--D-glutamate ligase [Chengkuizengella sp. 2205SS18-9]
MNHPRFYKDKSVLVLGLAKSGQAAAKLFHQYGAKVTINDRKERESCPEAESLEALGITVICGGHPPDLIHPELALIVKNPGIPYKIPPIKRALDIGIEIITEIEVAYHISAAPMIGITGSNGKTTTTSLIGEILSADYQSPIVAGNIGTPLCEVAQEAHANQWIVAELSSFQLKGIREFKPKISCLLNIYETHLDYHVTLEDYVESKKNLFKNQSSDEIAVLNWDDETCRNIAKEIQADILPISTKKQLDYGVYINDHKIIYKDKEGLTHFIIDTSSLGVGVRHNQENALAATAVAIAAKTELSVISDVLQQFKGIEHRLEFVASKDGIDYYNDSKATNPTATNKALEAFGNNVILIAGGLDRGSDYMELESQFSLKIKGLVTLGETRQKIKKVAESAGVQSVRSVEKYLNENDAINQAVIYAKEMSRDGDVILLSPACASWDMFKTFEDRGRMFKEAVHNL